MIEPILRNVYTGPSQDALQRQFDGYVYGTVRISDFEVRTMVDQEDAFVGILSARVQAAVDDMGAEVRAWIQPEGDALDDPNDTLERA